MFAVPTRALALLAALAFAACRAEPVAPAPVAVFGHDIELPAEARIVAARVTRGATMASLLRAHDVAEAEIAALVGRAAAVFDLRKVRVDQPYRLAQAINGALRRFEYEIDRDRVLRITRRPGDDAEPFAVEVAPIEKIARQTVVRGVIDGGATSLFAAMGRTGETADLSVALAAVFASEVDFNTEIQPGDRFEILVEKLYREKALAAYGPDDDRFAGYGPILAATLDNDGRHLTAFRFDAETGTTGYYDEQGRSLRRFFLRSPLKFEPVITSGFSRNRLHPVLHSRRAHLGVDYRAPVGAPVVAVADGTVVSAGWNGGAGRMVHLRHANGFESQYLHLSAISVRRGTRVAQGEVIGRVGASGMVTGAHLDYRLRKNGVFINPVTAHRAMPPGDPVTDARRGEFQEVRDRAFAALRGQRQETLEAEDATPRAAQTATIAN